MTDISEMIDTIQQGDCMDILRRLPDKCIDLVVTDPPYFNVVKAAWDRQWPTVQDFAAWCGRVGDELRRVMKDNASLYWFGDDKTIAYVQVELDKRFHLLNTLIWDKVNLTARPNSKTQRSFLPCSERILFYEQAQAPGKAATGLEQIHSNADCFASLKAYMRGERDKLNAARGFNTNKELGDYLRELTGATTYSHYFGDSQFAIPSRTQYANLQKSGFFRREYEDLRCEYEDLRCEYEDLRRPFNFDWNAREILRFTRDSSRWHLTQKPEKLISYLIEKSSRAGAIVLDPFAGSGTTAIAAHNTGRRFICIERDQDIHATVLKRYAQETAQQNLVLT